MPSLVVILRAKLSGGIIVLLSMVKKKLIITIFVVLLVFKLSIMKKIMNCSQSAWMMYTQK